MIRPLVLILAMSPAIALADTVWLKNGGTIDGKVILETPDRVVVDTGGGKMTIQRTEIDRVEKGGRAEEPEPPREKAPPTEPVKPPADEATPPAPAEGDDESGPSPSDVRIVKPEVRVSEGRLKLSMELVQPEGHALKMWREECRLESWSDDRGNSYDVSKPEYFDGLTVLGDGSTAGVDITIDGAPDASVESFHVAGTLVYGLGWGRHEGKTEAVELAHGTEFEMDGIPFVLVLPQHPFATEEEASTKTWIELRCPYRELQAASWLFLTDVTFWSEDGTEIPSRNNQMSDWSDEKGNAGLFFTYEIEGKPSKASLRYKLWSRLKTMTVPFELDAPIRR